MISLHPYSRYWVQSLDISNLTLHSYTHTHTLILCWVSDWEIGCNLPSLHDLFASRTLRRAIKIIADPSHPGRKLFESLPSVRRLQSIRTNTSHHKNSFCLFVILVSRWNIANSSILHILPEQELYVIVWRFDASFVTLTFLNQHLNAAALLFIFCMSIHSV